MAGGRRRLRDVAGHHAGASGSGRCCGWPTRSRPGPTRSSRAECRNTGKPVEPDPAGGDGAAAGRAAVLRRRRADAGGPVGRRVPARPHLLVRREPIGVCAQVAPWNYPMVMAVWKFAPAIAAGNTVVLKPSDTTPVTTLLLAEIAAEFLPPGVLNVVCGDRDTGRALIAHPTPAARVDHRLDPGRHGGRRRGRRRPQAGPPRARRQGAGRRLRRRRHRRRPPPASPGAGYFNAGQDCTAAARVLVQRADRRPTSPPRWPTAARATRVGGPDDPDAYFGPVNNPDQLARVQGFLDRDARPRRGGHRRAPDRRPGLLPRADRRGRTAAGRRDDPGRGVRPGHHRAAVHRRGRRRSAGPTTSGTA